MYKEFRAGWHFVRDSRYAFGTGVFSFYLANILIFVHKGRD